MPMPANSRDRSLRVSAPSPPVGEAVLAVMVVDLVLALVLVDVLEVVLAGPSLVRLGATLGIRMVVRLPTSSIPRNVVWTAASTGTRLVRVLPKDALATIVGNSGISSWCASPQRLRFLTGLTALPCRLVPLPDPMANFGLFAAWTTLPTSFQGMSCLLYTSPSPRDGLLSRMPSSA